LHAYVYRHVYRHVQQTVPVVCITHAQDRGRAYRPSFFIGTAACFTTWGSVCSWAVVGQGWAVAWAVHGLQSWLAGGGWAHGSSARQAAAGVLMP
jgi:hypothetical protein